MQALGRVSNGYLVDTHDIPSPPASASAPSAIVNFSVGAGMPTTITCVGPVHEPAVAYLGATDAHGYLNSKNDPNFKLWFCAQDSRGLTCTGEVARTFVNRHLTPSSGYKREFEWSLMIPSDLRDELTERLTVRFSDTLSVWL